jgi:hypothetical protein
LSHIEGQRNRISKYFSVLETTCVNRYIDHRYHRTRAATRENAARNKSEPMVERRLGRHSGPNWPRPLYRAIANECALEALAGATFQRMVCVRSRSDSAKVSADFAITNARGRSIGRLNWLRRSIWYASEVLRSLCWRGRGAGEGARFRRIFFGNIGVRMELRFMRGSLADQ